MYSMYSTPTGITVPGLKNLGNTCYAATILQALASCSALVQQLQLATDNLQALQQQHSSFAAVLLDCLQRLQPYKGALRSESPAEVLYALRQRVGEGVLPAGQEHDAVEAYEVISGVVSSELQKAFACCTKLQLEARGCMSALLRPTPPQATASVDVRTTPTQPANTQQVAHVPPGAAALQSAMLHPADSSAIAASTDTDGGGEVASCRTDSQEAADHHCSTSSSSPGHAPVPETLQCNGQEPGEAGMGVRELGCCPDSQGQVRTASSDQGEQSSMQSQLGRVVAGWAVVDDVLLQWRAMTRLVCQGSVASELQCMRCRHRFASQVTPFLVLPLTIPRAPGRTSMGTVLAAAGASVEQCLHEYFGFEALQGVACTRCSLQASLAADKAGSLGDRLERLRQALQQRVALIESDMYEQAVHAAGLEWVVRRGPVSKRHVAARLPTVLCLQLRRAFWTEAGEVKVSGHVRFPLVLQLEGAGLPVMGHGPPSSAASQPAAPLARFHGPHLAGPAGPEPTTGAPAAGSSAAAEGVQPPCIPAFHLRAVVVHYGGSSSGGHYIVYRSLDAAQQQWVCVSDERVAHVSPAEVLLADATMLFYDRTR